jgi:integrase
VPKGIKATSKRMADGTTRRYFYHRATGLALKEEPFSAAWLLEIAALDRKAEGLAARTVHIKARSFAALWDQYRAAQFPLLKPRTRKDYQTIRDWLGPNMASIPVTEITRGRILSWRDSAVKQRGWRFANYVVSVVRLVLQWGLEREWIKANPGREIEAIPRPTDLPHQNRALSLAEVRELLAPDLPAQLRLPICLGLFGPLREGDMLTLTLSAVQGQTLQWRAGKNAELAEKELTGPLGEAVRERLAQNHPAVQLCVNSRGMPWTESGFRASYFKHVRKLTAAGRLQPGVTFHGLRHTLGSLARDLGFSDFQIAASLADRSIAMAQTYGRDAMKKQARATVQEAVEEHLINNSLATVLATDLPEPPRRAKKP